MSFFREKIWDNLIHFLQNAAGFAKQMMQGIWQKIMYIFPDKKHRLILGALAGVIVVIIFVMVIISGKSGKSERAETRGYVAAERFSKPVIAQDDFFLPDEPDFVPGVLLERERRTSWSEDDASEYWQDPLKYGEEQWREKIEAVIDDFMERVP